MPPRKKAKKKASAKKKATPRSAGQVLASVREELEEAVTKKVTAQLEKKHAAEIATLQNALERERRNLTRARAANDRGSKAYGDLKDEHDKLVIEHEVRGQQLVELAVSVQGPALETRKRVFALLEYPQKFLDELVDDVTRTLLGELGRHSTPQEAVTADLERLTGNMGKLFASAVEAARGIPTAISYAAETERARAGGFCLEGIWHHLCLKGMARCAVGEVCPNCGRQAPR